MKDGMDTCVTDHIDYMGCISFYVGVNTSMTKDIAIASSKYTGNLTPWKLFQVSQRTINENIYNNNGINCV